MFGFLKRLFGGVPQNPLLVGVWAPVDGNPKETMEYHADGTVRMALFGGMMHMTGRYRFVSEDTVRIDWNNQSSPGMSEALDQVNKGLASRGVPTQARVMQQSVLQITVTDTELKTLHIEKGRRGHFRRVGGAPAGADSPAAGSQQAHKVVARSIVLGQVIEPRDLMQKIARIAGESVIETSRQDNIRDLTYTADSLARVDQILAAFHREGHSEDTIPTAILGFGWYVGEVMVRNNNGRWRIVTDVIPPQGGCAALVVEMPDGTVCDPIGQVLRLVKNGINDSVLFYYAMAATR